MRLLAEAGGPVAVAVLEAGGVAACLDALRSPVLGIRDSAGRFSMTFSMLPAAAVALMAAGYEKAMLRLVEDVRKSGSQDVARMYETHVGIVKTICTQAAARDGPRLAPPGKSARALLDRKSVV